MSHAALPTQQRRHLQAHFAFTGVPFRKNVKANAMFDSRAQRDVLRGLAMWLELHGIALIEGPSGVGKSITLRSFVNGLDESRYTVFRFSYIPTTVIGFLRSLSRALGLPMRLHAADLFNAAQEALVSYEGEHGPHPLLVIDDAEGLSAPVLDVIRRLTSYKLDSEDRFSVLLGSTEELLTTLRFPGMDSLRSRIGYAQALRPFALEDTRNYIRFHVKGAGVNDEIFSDEAERLLFQASQGKPRHINQIALQALIEAAVQGIDEVSGDLVRNLIATNPLFQLTTGEAP